MHDYHRIKTEGCWFGMGVVVGLFELLTFYPRERKYLEGLRQKRCWSMIPVCPTENLRLQSAAVALRTRVYSHGVVRSGCRVRSDAAALCWAFCALGSVEFPLQEAVAFSPQLICFLQRANPSLGTSGEGAACSSPSHTILHLLISPPAVCRQLFKWRNCKLNVTGKLNICHLVRKGL